MNKQPAIFSPVKSRWIKEACHYFNSGKTVLYFYTNSNHISDARQLKIKHVYFKPKGNCHIVAVADFVDLLFDNPRKFRLSENKDEIGKYYYGFRNLKNLQKLIPLKRLSRFPSCKILRNDVPGVCLINDPL